MVGQNFVSFQLESSWYKLNIIWYKLNIIELIFLIAIKTN